MNATLRFNEALLITGRAFQPYQCVAWSELGSDGGLSLSVVDRTGTRLLGRARIPSSAYSDPSSLPACCNRHAKNSATTATTCRTGVCPAKAEPLHTTKGAHGRLFSFPLFEAVVLPERHAHRVAPCILGLVERAIGLAIERVQAHA